LYVIFVMSEAFATAGEGTGDGDNAAAVVVVAMVAAAQHCRISQAGSPCGQLQLAISFSWELRLGGKIKGCTLHSVAIWRSTPAVDGKNEP
jgi:hypothetical protein